MESIKAASIGYDQYVEDNFRWNFSVNLIDIAFITLALSLISRETIMPLFVSSLTDSRIMIGLIPAIYNLGYYLPQLLTASLTESMPRKKPFVMMIGGVAERGPYLVMGLATLALADQSPTLLLIVFFLLLATTAIGNGVATPGWFTMIGKVLPVNRRGIFFGVSGGLGALMGVIGAQFMGEILTNENDPGEFAPLFLIAFVFTAISWVGLALNHEPVSPVVKEQVPFTRYLKHLPTILHQNGNYRQFLISYSISRLGAMAVGFFAVFGDAEFDLSGGQVGLLTGVLIGSQAVMQLIWGWLGDRRGHLLVLQWSSFLMALTALVGVITNGFGGLVVVFLLLGSALAGDSVSKFNIILEFAPSEDQPTYIGLTNTLLAPVVVLGPILGGWLATVLDYRGMFVVAMAFALAGGILLLSWVREPRTESPAANTMRFMDED